MSDYLRYYLSPLTILVGVAGLWLGDIYVWVGLASLPVLALGDTIFGRDLRPRRMNNLPLAYVPVVMSSFIAFAMFCLLSYRIAQGELSGVNTLGAILSTGWVATIVGVPAFHELFHRREAVLRNLGLALQVMYFDPTRDIAHVVGHHIDVGTHSDSDTARRGQSLYTFALMAMWHSFVTSQRKEGELMRKLGHKPWSFRHRIWRAAGGLVIFEAIMFLIGGLYGMLACVAAGLLARFLLESFNYFQHYGQVRLPGTTIEKRHVWNHFGKLSRMMTFEITNHAGHHLNAFAPYYNLEPDKEAVQLPSVFVCFMAALVPPAWHRLIIMPALRKWDLEKASEAERELAKAQNKDAGWPDWFRLSDSALGNA
jgi:fatty acid desaturase